MIQLSRRQVLAFGTAATLSATYGATVAGRMPFAAQVVLRVERRVIEISNRPASVFGILQPDGTQGLTLDPGTRFAADLENRTGESTLIHWHGQTPPTDQDGVPGLSQDSLVASGAYSYEYEARPGSHWMHSHVGLQKQEMMAAPLIVRTRDDLRDEAQEVIIMLQDFTFRDPEEVFADLQQGAGGHGAMKGAAASDMATHGATMNNPGDAVMGKKMPTVMHGAAGSRHGGAMKIHLNDVDYDAYLANDRTLDDPEEVRVESGGRVRLRIINAASSTNFIIDLGALEGRIVAVDGNRVTPVSSRRMPIAMAQRLDVIVNLPNRHGAWPILALREGDRARTGIVLATARGQVRKMSPVSGKHAENAGLDLEGRLSAVEPLVPRPARRIQRLVLSDGKGPYGWGLNGKVWGEHKPIDIMEGERIEIVFENETIMSHPMHLHGHHFQVVSIDGQRFSGALRDTVLVPARGEIGIAFDADNYGRWAFHCHNLYHMAAGMMTEVRYVG